MGHRLQEQQALLWRAKQAALHEQASQMQPCMTLRVVVDCLLLSMCFSSS